MSLSIPSIWTKNYESCKVYRTDLVNKIKDYMENYDEYKRALENKKWFYPRTFFSGEALYKAVK